VQTPQGFTYETILKAYHANRFNLSEFTDDAALVEANGGKVIIIPGERSNIKITTPDDLCIADATAVYI
jgi:2-C-methyl-D-erythritol 4-phosphate cytidylyltransferase